MIYGYVKRVMAAAVVCGVGLLFSGAASASNESECKNFCKSFMERNPGSECKVAEGNACWGQKWHRAKHCGGSGRNYSACENVDLRNKVECQSACDAYKKKYPGRECKVNDKNVCWGLDWDQIKHCGGAGENYSACAESDYARESAQNEKECKAWCAQHKDDEGCVQCSTLLGCGGGLKNLKDWGGKGKNWHACQQTNWAKNSQKSLEQAQNWCKEYTAESGGQKCKIVKSGTSCPGDYYKAERLDVTWGRDHWVCLEHKQGEQRVLDCSGGGTANIEKALQWLDTHFETILKDFELKDSDYRNRRAEDRLDRKFPKTTVLCRDDKNKCKDHAGTQGWSLGGRRVYLCYNKKKTFCSLVRTVLHEAGHNAWADKCRDHNDPNNDKRLKDTVYQLGHRAEDLCTGKNTNNSNIVPAGSKSYDFNL